MVMVVSTVLLAALNAFAVEGPRDDKSEGVSAVTRARRVNTRATAGADYQKVSYALYDGALTSAPSSESNVRTVGGPLPNRPSPPPPPPPVSTAPMTAGEKFHFFVQRSFLSPGAYAQSIVSGTIGEWMDGENDHHHANPGDFTADSLTRAARSFTFRANANFFEKFFFASIFKQDPRYHRSGKKGVGAKIGYAVSRIFITQGDRNGKDEFNISLMAGGLAASGMANLWERDKRTDINHFATRFGSHMAFTVLTNLIKEFLSGQ
jgi:hypothetical protein